MKLSRIQLIVIGALLVVLTILLVQPTPTSADIGTVTVTATASAKLSITITDAMADFGVAVAPDGTGTGGEITSVVGTSGVEGSYYLWTPSSQPLVTVRSNKPWNGTISASENSGTATSLTIASGVLRYSTSLPSDYAAAAAVTAFTATPDIWESNHIKGLTTYNYYYALRVNWNDDPGTFASTVTYAVIQ